jgi:4-amino-4-deoxy-L-arabinose transferase-like glycosyltransferase
MLLAILMVLFARVRLLSAPLERHEGEYAYIGQLMLQGVPPYAEAANMKLPGTHAAYALIMAIFGQTVLGIHVGFLLVNAGAGVLVYFLAKRLLGSVAGFAAAASYAVLSVGPSVLGIWAHATHFVVLFALGATLLLLKWTDTRKTHTLIGSGLLFGIAFLMKQPGILFAVFGVLYLIYVQRRQLRSSALPVLRSLVVFGSAVMLPFGIMCFLLWRAGVFETFWLWVFTYARLYVSVTSLPFAMAILENNAPPILLDNLGLILLAPVGLFLLWRDKANRDLAMLLTGFLVCSLLAVCPGLYFRPHYFVLMLPAVALLIGAVAGRAKETVVGAITIWVITGSLAYSLWHQRGFLFQTDPLAITRMAYLTSPFPEAIPVGDYIRAHSKKEDRIVVLGSEPEIYFYSQRRSVTPYLYVFPLVENQPLAAWMQTEYIHDVETKHPAYVVLVNCQSSWARRPNSPTMLMDWAVPYLSEHYDEIGVVDLLPYGSIYQWGPAAATYARKSPEFVIVLKRKGDDR